MKLTFLIALAGVVSASVLNRAAKPDACAQALTSSGRTTRPLTVAKSDCSSYLSTQVTKTVTKPAVTTTKTMTATVSATSTALTTATTTVVTVVTVVTVTTTTGTTTTTSTMTTIGPSSGVQKRATSTTTRTIPTYATSACRDAAHYSTACASLGVRPTTNTSTFLLTPTVTATVNTTSTVRVNVTSTVTTTTVTSTSTTTTSVLATATAINYCGVVGRCGIDNININISGGDGCKAFAQSPPQYGDPAALSYSVDDFGICYIYAYRIEDPACFFSPTYGGLSWGIDC